jgi:hypothetical protein
MIDSSNSNLRTPSPVEKTESIPSVIEDQKTHVIALLKDKFVIINRVVHDLSRLCARKRDFLIIFARVKKHSFMIDRIQYLS